MGKAPNCPASIRDATQSPLLEVRWLVTLLKKCDLHTGMNENIQYKLVKYNN